MAATHHYAIGQNRISSNAMAGKHAGCECWYDYVSAIPMALKLEEFVTRFTLRT
jgi:hypothetical protein